MKYSIKYSMLAPHG